MGAWVRGLWQEPCGGGQGMEDHRAGDKGAAARELGCVSLESLRLGLEYRLWVMV